MKLKFVSLLLASLFVVGCNSSSNTSNGNPPSDNPGGNDVTELGYNPAQRWPEQGDFSYNHKYSYNGNSCETGKKTFGNRADFCMGLQDQKLNNDCALPTRQMAYKNQCGDDFQELNFKSEFYKSGFDSYIQQQCSTSTAVATFRNLKHYCDFLKDESLHKNCFWNSRQAHFDAKKCLGNFSTRPEQVAAPVPQPQPNPQPNPNPNPNPQPIPNPNDPIGAIPVVQELRANGVNVLVDWEPIRQIGAPHLPGEPTIEQKMKLIWAELDANKAEIIKRKNLINEVEITIYTQYHVYVKNQLQLDFETKPGTLKEYFPLFDKMITYQNELKIKFDFIHNEYAETVSFAPLRKVVAVIETDFALFKSVAGVVAEIDLDSFSSYYAWSKKLTINRDKILTELPKYLRWLAPLGPAMQWAQKNEIKIDVDFDIEKDTDKVQEAFKTLHEVIPYLDAMAKLKKLSEIKIYFDDGQQTFYPSLKKLTLNIGPTNKAQFIGLMTKLGRISQYQLESNITIVESNSYSDLDENFEKAFGYLEKFWTKIKAKGALIQSIELSYSSSFSGKQLRLGYSSTEVETEKVINDIK